MTSRRARTHARDDTYLPSVYFSFTALAFAAAQHSFVELNVPRAYTPLSQLVTVLHFPRTALIFGKISHAVGLEGSRAIAVATSNMLVYQ